MQPTLGAGGCRAARLRSGPNDRYGHSACDRPAPRSRPDERDIDLALRHGCPPVISYLSPGDPPPNMASALRAGQRGQSVP